MLAQDIDATHVDYQIAVLKAGGLTQAYRTDLAQVKEDVDAGTRAHGPAYENFYDVLGTVYGADDPSAVGNSQLHYGVLVNVAIENQPLYRGAALQFAVAESIKYLSWKLLVPNFSFNDFGDTHSLMLIINGLSARAALERLDPSLSASTFAAIFTQSSSASAWQDASRVTRGGCPKDLVGDFYVRRRRSEARR
ncbi:hypothetical protein [Ramlibacter sp. AN1133]|uniref:hypothetical protein n=1 Tax=Ramlibacter sp. AN1133 TaxID=3133429 RepID=UPI0030BF721B